MYKVGKYHSSALSIAARLRWYTKSYCLMVRFFAPASFSMVGRLTGISLPNCCPYAGEQSVNNTNILNILFIVFTINEMLRCYSVTLLWLLQWLRWYKSLYPKQLFCRLD